MAVFTVTSYTEKRGGAKASIRYIQGRPGRKGERLTRQLFGADGGMSREQALSLIDEAKPGRLFYRLVISPDPLREDTKRDLSLREIAQHTMQTLEKRLRQEIAWAGAVHDDHSPNRHVHIVAVLTRRLRVNDLKLLRQSSTQAALLQRQRLDLIQTHHHRLGLITKPPALKHQSSRLGAGTRRGTPAGGLTRSHNPFNRHLCTCPHCLTTHDKRLETKIHRCHNCRRRLHMEPKLTPSRGKSREEAGWER